MNNIVTTDLKDFGYVELEKARDLLSAYLEQGLPEDFYKEGITINLNKRSGCVFLSNEDYQVAMLNGSKLENWHCLGYSGIEGFIDDLIEEYENGNIEEIEDLEQLADILEASDNSHFVWLSKKIRADIEALEVE